MCTKFYVWTPLPSLYAQIDHSLFTMVLLAPIKVKIVGEYCSPRSESLTIITNSSFFNESTGVQNPRRIVKLDTGMHSDEYKSACA